MSESTSLAKEREEFEASAQEYLRYLREEHPEHFMESVAQFQQRKIFCASFDLIAVENPMIHAYGELLVQWRDKAQTIRKIVPDNMVVVSEEQPTPNGSYDLPLQPAPPFWVLEYVSKNNERKDYEDSFDIYEQELEVPYYLIFYPETQDLTLYRYNGRRYVTVKPNGQGLHAIPEIEVSAGLVDGWARFWFRGRLLPLTAELQTENNDLRNSLADANREMDELRQQMAKMAAELQRLQGQQVD